MADLPIYQKLFIPGYGDVSAKPSFVPEKVRFVSHEYSTIFLEGFDSVDVAPFYKFIESAIDAADEGDLILVYPGSYFLFGYEIQKSVNIHFFSGATLSSPVGSNALIIDDEDDNGDPAVNNVNITGHLRMNYTTNPGIAKILKKGSGDMNLEFDSIQGDGISVKTNAGNTHINCTTVSDVRADDGYTKIRATELGNFYSTGGNRFMINVQGFYGKFDADETNGGVFKFDEGVQSSGQVIKIVDAADEVFLSGRLERLAQVTAGSEKAVHFANSRVRMSSFRVKNLIDRPMSFGNGAEMIFEGGCQFITNADYIFDRIGTGSHALYFNAQTGFNKPVYSTALTELNSFNKTSNADII